MRNPTNTIFDAKRLIGRPFSDPLVQEDIKSWPFKLVPGPGDKPLFEVDFKGQTKQYSAEVRTPQSIPGRYSDFMIGNFLHGAGKDALNC